MNLGRPIVTNGDFATQLFPNYFGKTCYKCMHLCFFDFCRAKAELEKEANMCNLHHVNIVTFFAITSETGHYGIVMEYVLNGSLEDFTFKYSVCCSVSDLFNFVHIGLSQKFDYCALLW